MAGQEEYRVPADVDSPIPIFSWDVTELVVGILIFGIFIVLGSFLLGLVAFLVTLSAAKKLKSGEKRGQVQHILWRLGLNIDMPLRRHAPNPLWLEYIK